MGWAMSLVAIRLLVPVTHHTIDGCRLLPQEVYSSERAH
jgi:hypothetical protein